MFEGATKINVIAPGGNRISCYQMGLGNRQTVILTSGIGCGPIFMQEIAQDLARDYQVIYWDYRGHGGSDVAPFESGYSIAEHADDLDAVVKAFSPHIRPLMVAFSMGVQVNVEWAQQNPDGALAYVFLLGVPRNPLHRTKILRKKIAKLTDKVANSASNLLNMAQPVWQKAMRRPLTYTLAKSLGFIQSDCPKEQFEMFVQYATDVPLDAYLRCGAGIIAHDGIDAFLSIRQPVFMMAADQDVLIDPQECGTFADFHPQARFELIDQSSHAGLLEKGEYAAKTIRHYFEEIFYAQQQAA